MNAEIQQLAAADNPLETLEAFFAYWKSVMEVDDFHSGCPIAMATLGSFDTPDLASAAAAVFASWQDSLSGQLLRVGMPAETAASLSSFAVSAVEGAVIQCLAYRSTQPLDVAHEHLAATLRRHLAGR
jgi:hypothetical protein